jgi:hypothetical protein
MELVWNSTKAFTHPRYIDEMRGIADGSGVPVQDVFNINMIAELIKAQCSIIGANGAATMSSLGGTLVHLRTLDGLGGSTMPIKDYAMVTVYHPHSGPAVANFGWMALVGMVTGFGEYVGVGEKYWGNHSESVTSTHGEAWTFVTRDIASAASFDDALQVLSKANRTCAVHLGIGSRSNRFVGVEEAARALIYFNDTSINYPEHPIFPGIVYWDQYPQPTSSFCFRDLFNEQYGSLTAEWLATTLAPRAETGHLHSAVFDYHNHVAYFSNARKTYETEGSTYAFGRQYTLLNMTVLFQEQL